MAETSNSGQASARPIHRVEVLRNVRIPLPDGVTLAADLYKPAVVEQAGEGERFPVIIEYTPYHKINNAAYGPRASRYPYFASHGYVFVNVDIRGTGDSEGCNTGPSSDEERRDILEVIRWCGRQPWSDGSVGMIGISYTAGVCYDAARQAPDELKAIVVCQMCSDWYDGMAWPGGSPRPFGYENFAPLMAAYNFAPPNPELLGPKWAETWQQRLEGSQPWGMSYLRNIFDGPFWEERLMRGKEAQVRAATFLIGGWCDWYPDDLLKVFSRLNCPKRALIGPWTHNYPENAWPLPRLNDRYECLRWFDKHLKGIDTDPQRPLDDEPPITLFFREFTKPEALRRNENGFFRHETEWPPRLSTMRTLHLGLGSRLHPESTADYSVALAHGKSELMYRPDVGFAAGRYAIGQMLPGWGMADDQRLDEGLSLCFTADPVGDDAALELSGIPEVRLFLSSSAEVAFLSVKLCDVAPHGASVLVSKAVLNLTHRDSHSQPEPLVPGKIYEITLPLQGIAYAFRPGQRLRLMIAAADFQNEWPTPLPHTLTLHHGPEHPSRISLPVAGQPVPALPTPYFLPSEFAPLPPDQIPTPEYGIHRDLIQQTATVKIVTKSGAGINRSNYTINIERPAEAVIQSEFEYPVERPGMAILVHSQCVTRSDATAFHHLTEVEITINGRPHWNKSWSESVPRILC